MSELLTTAAGRAIMRQATIDRIRERMKRWFDRNCVIASNDWAIDDEFELSTVLGELNEVHDDEIYELNDLLNFLLAGDATVENRTFYVNPTTGSDETGIGTLARPFGSLEFITYSLPESIEHEIRVNLAAGTYTEFPDLLLKDKMVKNNGRIIFDASGETYPVVEGPFTINTANGVGAAGPDGASLAYDITPVGAPAWTTNEHAGNFIHFTSGLCAGQVFSIYANTATTLRMGVDWYGAAPGDTFNIVSCPAVIQCSTPTFIQGCTTSINRSSLAFAGDQDSPHGIYLYFCGIEFRYSPTVPIGMVIEHTCPMLSFVKILSRYTADTNSLALIGINSMINNNPVEATVFQNAALADWYVSNFYVGVQDGVISDGCWGVYLYSCSVNNLVCGSKMSLFSSTSYSTMATGQESSGYCVMSYAFYQQFVPVPAYSVKHRDDLLYFTSCYFDTVIQAIQLYNSKLRLEWAQGASITGNYCVKLYSGFTGVTVANLASVTFVGALGQYEFDFNATGYPAFPAIGVSTNDGGGSFAKTVS